MAVVHLSVQTATDDESEAKLVLQDLLEHMKDRLEYWGFGCDSPIQLLGEVV